MENDIPGPLQGKEIMSSEGLFLLIQISKLLGKNST